MITHVCGTSIEEWVCKFEGMPSTTIKELTKLPAQCAMLLVMEFIRSNPTMAMRNIADIRECLLHDIPNQHFTTVHKPTPDAPIISTGKVVLEVRIDDVVRLRSLTAHHTPTLNRCGHWWKVLQAYVPKPGQTIIVKPRWYLRSLTRKEQGLAPIKGFTFENLWIDKENDPNFEITHVCPFPKEFNYREYE